MTDLLSAHLVDRLPMGRPQSVAVVTRSRGVLKAKTIVRDFQTAAGLRALIGDFRVLLACWDVGMSEEEVRRRLASMLSKQATAPFSLPAVDPFTLADVLHASGVENTHRHRGKAARWLATQPRLHRSRTRIYACDGSSSRPSVWERV
jgi:hypothetical protein